MELDLHRNFLPMGDLIIWLDQMDKTDLTVLDEDEEQLYKEVQQAVLMASHMDVLDEFVSDDRINAYLDQQLEDVYGKAAVDFLGQWVDWEQCYNALKMDWGTVTIGEHDWWYRK